GFRPPCRWPRRFGPPSRPGAATRYWITTRDGSALAPTRGSSVSETIGDAKARSDSRRVPKLCRGNHGVHSTCCVGCVCKKQAFGVSIPKLAVGQGQCP